MFAVWVGTLLIGLVSSASAQPGKIYGKIPNDDTPLVEGKPFFEIHLNKQNKFAILHVLPNLTHGDGRPVRPPFPVGQRGVLVFNFVNDPDTKYEVPWPAVVKVRTFDEMVLEKAEQAMVQRDFATAFKGYLFLYDRNRANRNLRKALQNYLFLDGKNLLDKGVYDEAISVFEELYERNREFVYPGQVGGLQGAIKECYDKLLERKADAGDLPGIRKMLAYIENKYADRAKDLVTKWKGEIVKVGQRVLAEAKQAAEGDDAFEAHRKVRTMIHAIPEIAESKVLFEKVLKKFPYVFVGVTQHGRDFDSASINHWGDRRLGQLMYRKLVQFVEPGDEGGKYEFSSGQIIRQDEAGLTYRFQIDQLPDKPAKLGSPPITAYGLSSRLLELGDIESGQTHLPWARVVKSVRIDNRNSVIVKLNFPHIRPDSLLQVAPKAYPNSKRPPDGFYAIKDQDERRTIYHLNPRYPKVSGRQHPQIIERMFSSRAEADLALFRGEIDVVDRIFPADVQLLKSNPNIVIRPYNLPTVHLLVPNPRNDFLKSRDYRIGLLYGMNRELILKEMIAGGNINLPGFEIVSGPFPNGTDDADQTAYAYDHSVKPVIHNVYLGITMIAFAQQRMVNQMTKDAEKIFRSDMDLLTKEDPKQALLKKIQDVVKEIGNESKDELHTRLFPELAKTFPESNEEELEEKLKKFVDKIPGLKEPEITLAFPADDMIELACEAIAQNWAVIGVKVKLRKLPKGEVVPKDGDYDLLYTEITMQEPLLDIFKVLGDTGLATQVSASINLELQQIARASKWSEAYQSLKTIHKHCNSEMAVIPLWQVVEHYAYRKNLKNTGNQISSLYQNVDRWQLGAPEYKK